MVEKTLARPIERIQLWIRQDVRLWQIAFQVSFLSLGYFARDFNLHMVQVVGAVASAFATQWFWMTQPWKQMRGRPHGNQRSAALEGRSLSSATNNDSMARALPSKWLSALITSCGVSLLLRANDWWIHAAAVCFGVSAKFLISFRGKHLFNPATVAVIFSLVFLPGTWVSPSQWGQEWLALFWIVALGLLVTSRAKSLNISLSFLLSWVILLFVKIIYLGQVWSHFWHQLNNGALMIFAFFMISDPMTIPNDGKARRLYAFFVALFAFVWQFVYFRPNGFLWSLFLLAPLVPLIDLIWRAPKYQWQSSTGWNVQGSSTIKISKV